MLCALLLITLNAPTAPRIVAQSGHVQSVTNVQVSPDGARLASISQDGVRVWNRDGVLLWSLWLSGDARVLAWSGDSRELAVGFGGTPGFFVGKPGDSAGVQELSATDGKVLRRLLFGNNTIESIEYRGDVLRASSGEGIVQWSADSTREKVVEARSSSDYDSPDGKYRALLRESVQIWRIRDKTRVALLPRSKTPGAFALWTPDSKYFATFNGRELILWNEARARTVALFSEKEPSWPTIANVVLAPDGQTLLCARTDYPHPREEEDQAPESGAPRGFLWRVALDSGVVQTLRKATPRSYESLAFWPDGTLVLGGGRETVPGVVAGELFFARLQNDDLQSTWQMPAPLGEAFVGKLSPDGKTLAIGDDDTAIRLWNLRSGRLEKTLKEYSTAIIGLDWSPDGKRIGALDYENAFVFSVDTGRGRKMPGLAATTQVGNSVEWSPDGKKLLLATGFGGRILDVATSKTRKIEVFHPAHWIAPGILRAGAGLQLLDAATLKPKWTLRADGVGSERAANSIDDFAFVDGGARFIALTRTDGPDEAAVQLWNIEKRIVARTLSGFPDAFSLAVSPDQKRFALGNGIGEVAVFDVSTFGDAPAIWRLESGARADFLCFSADGSALLAGGADGFTRAFDAQNGALRATLCTLPPQKRDEIGHEWLRFSPDGNFAASAKAAPSVRVVDGAVIAALGELSTRETANLALVSSFEDKRQTLTLNWTPPRPRATATPHPTTKAREPMLVVQGDKIYQPRAVAVSNGGQWAATSEDSIKLWDGKNGLQWGEFGANGITPLRFTPDATRLLAAPTDPVNSPGGKVALYAIPSGQKLREYSLDASPLWSDNARVMGLKNGEIVVFDLATGRRLATRKIQSPPPLEKNERSLQWAFSRDGRFLSEGSAGTLRLWRTGDGALLWQHQDALRAIGKTAISSDGNWLASEGDDPKWSPPTDGPMTEASYARTFQLHVWNVKTKKLAQTFPGYYSLDGGAALLQFSADNRFLLGARDSGLDRWSLPGGQNSPLPPHDKDGLSPLGAPIAISPDGLWMAGQGRVYQSSDFGPGLQLWSLAGGKAKALFAGTLRAPSKLAYSPDGKYLAGGGEELSLWDARTGALLAHKAGVYVYDLDWADASTLRTQTLGAIEWYAAPSLEKRREIDFSAFQIKSQNGPSGYSDGVSISPDGTRALTTNLTSGGSLFGEVWVWDLASKTVLQKIKYPRDEKDTWGSSGFSRVVWLPDNRRIVFGTKIGMTLLDTKSGEIVKKWRDPTDETYTAGTFADAMTPLAVSPDGKWLIVRASRDSTALVYDLQSLDFVRRLPVAAGYLGTFSRDGHTAILTTAKGLEWWDVTRASDAAQQVLRGASGEKLAFSPDEKFFAGGSNSVTSNGASIWSVARNRVVVRLFLLGGTTQNPRSDWIALASGGFYNASPEGEKRLRWRDEKGFWPLEKSRAAFRKPEKVAQALSR